MSDILIEDINQSRVIKINRPKVYNALTRDNKIELYTEIEKASRDEKVRSVVLTAEGKAFCTGQDLNDRTVSGDEKIDLGTTLKEEWNPLVESIRNCEKPVICVVNGVCAGAGISVALSCDLVLAKKDVKFVSGFTKLGLIPDAGSSHKFAHALGTHKAFEFFAFNEPLLSQQMSDYGLINKISENPMEEALKWSETLNRMAPLSLKELKKNLQNALDLTYNETLDKEVDSQRLLGHSEDYGEGVKAFFEKRQANFKGL